MQSLPIERRRPGRPVEGDVRSCILCGGTQRFSERAIARGSLMIRQPLWVCRCGIELMVRAPRVDRSHGTNVADRRDPPNAGLSDLRRTLAAARERAQAHPEWTITPRARVHTLLAAACGHSPFRISAIAIDDRARHLAANRAACALSGYSEDELLGMTIWGLSVDHRALRDERRWLRFLRVGEFEGKCFVQRKTGEPVAVQCVAAAHVLPGIHLCALAPRPLLRATV